MPILFWLTTSFLLVLAKPFAALLTTATNAPTITNYYQDFAACSCDLSPALCDNYCCCDPLCV